MEKVLNITARLKDKRRKEQVETYRDRFEAIQRVLQCTACHFKCAMCNRHIERTDPSNSPPPPLTEFSLCESCRSEFEAFKKMSQEGSDRQDVFWHNSEWIELWTCWLDYQRSIKKFRNSFDFDRLTD
ncbi:MAG: hypothetical protein JRL30_06145 [Deltaproteobacteria bacterium]|nr:hypothetical protein [Deltaproteobacteria bacterium]